MYWWTEPLWRIVGWNSRCEEMSDRKRADQLWDWQEAQLREVDYWIAMSEKVGRERLVHEGMPEARRQSVVSEGSDFEVDMTWVIIPTQCRAIILRFDSLNVRGKASGKVRHIEIRETVVDKTLQCSCVTVKPHVEHSVDWLGSECNNECLKPTEQSQLYSLTWKISNNNYHVQ